MFAGTAGVTVNGRLLTTLTLSARASETEAEYAVGAVWPLP